jgi:hypothetical protein
MAEGLERVERLLALLLVANLRDSDQTGKIVALKAAGFTNHEIAALLSTSPGVVAQQLYARKSKGKSARTRPGPA